MIQNNRTSTNHCNRHGGEIGKEQANTQRSIQEIGTVKSRQKVFTNVVKQAVLVIIILMIQKERRSTNRRNHMKELANTQRSTHDT